MQQLPLAAFALNQVAHQGSDLLVTLVSMSMGRLDIPPPTDSGPYGTQLYAWTRLPWPDRLPESPEGWLSTQHPRPGMPLP